MLSAVHTKTHKKHVPNEIKIQLSDKTKYTLAAILILILFII